MVVHQGFHPRSNTTEPQLGSTPPDTTLKKGNRIELPYFRFEIKLVGLVPEQEIKLFQPPSKSVVQQAEEQCFRRIVLRKLLVESRHIIKILVAIFETEMNCRYPSVHQ